MRVSVHEASYFSWNYHHTFLHLELSLVSDLVFISRGGSPALLYSSEALSSITVSLSMGASGSYLCMFIGVNLELLSLVLRNKSHPYFV